MNQKKFVATSQKLKEVQALADLAPYMDKLSDMTVLEISKVIGYKYESTRQLLKRRELPYKKVVHVKTPEVLRTISKSVLFNMIRSSSVAQTARDLKLKEITLRMYLRRKYLLDSKLNPIFY